MTSVEQCVVCPEGTSCSVGSDQATPCAPGTFNPTAQRETCTNCEAGTFQEVAGQTACVACTAGYYCGEGAAAALPCPGGTHKNASLLVMSSVDQCVVCPRGTFCSVGADEPTPCDADEIDPSHLMRWLPFDGGRESDGDLQDRNTHRRTPSPPRTTAPRPDALRSADDYLRGAGNEFWNELLTLPAPATPSNTDVEARLVRELRQRVAGGGRILAVVVEALTDVDGVSASNGHGLQSASISHWLRGRGGLLCGSALLGGGCLAWLAFHGSLVARGTTAHGFFRQIG